MLNIISRSIISSHNRGPRKVVNNLLQGLDKLNYPYVINAALDATDSLWIHDDPVALSAAMKLPENIKIVAGPNIYTLPREIPENINIDRIIWIHPSLWVQKFWEKSTTKKINSIVWPVGIDTDKFCPSDTKKDLFIVYNKNRDVSEIEAVSKALEACQKRFEVITYGNYQEENYLNLLRRAKGIIWVGRSESQGIGLLEALAMNVPALVWDIYKFGQWSGTGKDKFNKLQLDFIEATTAPYFNSNCGIIFKDEAELEINLDKFLTSLNNFSPRSYVMKNLSDTKQAQELINIYIKHYKQTENSLKDSNLNNTGAWKNRKLLFKLVLKTKDAIRQIIR